MRGLPASAFITETVAQMAYTTESTPQSTINHNAVIEFASNLKVAPRRGRDVGSGAQKAGPPAQKGGLKSAGTMPKSQSRCNAKGGKFGRFRQLFAPEPAVLVKFLEMAIGPMR